MLSQLEARDVPSVVYDTGFQGATAAGSQWSARAASGAAVTPGISTTPVGNRQFLGQFGNTTATLSLAGLPAHDAVTISFDLYVINSWDGSDVLRKWGPDGWSFAIDGQSQLSTTFSNQPLPSPGAANNVQTFGGQWLPAGTYPAFTGAAEVNTLGYKFYRGSYQRLESMDSVYRFTYTVPHAGDSVRFDFRGFGLQGLSDESWGLDNVRVTATELPVVSIRAMEPTNLLTIEEWGSADVVIERSGGDISQSLSIRLVTSSDGVNPLANSDDYLIRVVGGSQLPETGELTFAPNENSIQIRIDARPDDLEEFNEGFLFSVVPNGIAIFPDLSAVSVLLLDDKANALNKPLEVKLDQGTLTFAVSVINREEAVFIATHATTGLQVQLPGTSAVDEGSLYAITGITKLQDGVATLRDGDKVKWPPKLLILSGADAKGGFREKNSADPDAKSEKYYWAQYINYSIETNSEPAKRAYSEQKPGNTVPVGDGKWYFDGKDLKKAGFPDFYSSQSLTASHEVTDRPSGGLQLTIDDTTEPLGLKPANEDGLRLYIVKATTQPTDAIDRKLQELKTAYGKDFSIIQTFKFQSYIIDKQTGVPLGYVSWGYTMTTDVAKKEFAKVTVIQPVWNQNSDKDVFRKVNPSIG